MHSIPLVSCIMPTANREKFIPLAIHYYLRQDYQNSELIILDDGINPVSNLIPKNEKIKYYRANTQQKTIGFKRNLACEAANGEIIIHWDDDDWYAPNWISYQVKIMLSTNADICGLRELFFFSPFHKKLWKYIYPSNEQPWVAGATMAYKKSHWQKKKFSDIQVGEDNQFVWFSGGNVIAHPYINGFLSILHSGNTSPKYTTNSRWIPHDPNEHLNFLQADRLIYG